jgi:hypothetical protein
MAESSEPATSTPRLPVAENESDAKEGWRQLHRQFGLRQKRQEAMNTAGHQKDKRHGKLDCGTERHPFEDPSARRRATDGRPQHLGACRAFRVRQLAMALHNQQPAQRNHRGKTKNCAEVAQDHHLQVRRNDAPHEQRRHGKDGSARE